MIMKIEEMMQPLEEDELEEVSGGVGGKGFPIFQCRSCGHCFPFGGNCPDCGGTLDYIVSKNSGTFIL